MANVQIPSLPSASGLNGQELLEAVQDGVSVKITTGNIAALVPAQNQISTGFVTLYQFMSAIPIASGSKPSSDPNTLFAAIGNDFNNAYTVQFYTSKFVKVNDPIFNLTASTYGYNTSQMSSLMAVAYTLPQWG